MSGNPTIERTLYALVAATVVLTAAAGPARAGEPAKKILEAVDRAGDMKTSRMEMKQTTFSPTGDQRTFTLASYSADGGASGLSEYLAPSRVAGMKILTLHDGDDIWAYFPRTNRTRKIASSARNRRVQGSDFTYDDLAMGKMARHWQGEVKGTATIDGDECWELEVKPTPKGPRSYSKATIWVKKANHTIVRAEYYDRDGDKTKRLDVGDYRRISGVLVPHRYTMTSLADGGHTEMVVTKAEVNPKLDHRLFTEAALGR